MADRDLDTLTRLVQMALEQLVREQATIEIDKVKKKLDEALPEIVARVCINVGAQISMERMRDELIIRVKVEK